MARLLKSINADTPEEGTMTTDSYHDTSLDMTRGAISPGQHAMLDYGVAAMFFAMGFSMLRHHKPAAALAIGNGALITGMSLLTDYPGGMFRVLDFRSHRTGDMVQAAIAGLGPIALGFANDPEAKYFYGQAASEVAAIAATDWDAAPRH